ncbi:MAG: hypothetical protein WBA41_08440 [Rivularia sp. (in: cyanobacteria)]
MSDFSSILGASLYSRSLSIFIPTDVCNEEFDALLKQADCINRAKAELLKSDISTDDYLDAVEFFGVDIDKYVIEIENNLNNNLNDLYR